MINRPDYAAINREKQKRFIKIINSRKLISASRAYYKTRPVHWIMDWGVTYDPRNSSVGIPTLMPFVLFERQKQMVRFLYECFTDSEHGVIEKCRDYGATWVCCNFSIWLWMYWDGSSIGWGSRKEILVDKLGDPDSIFEKMRIILDNLPSFCKPNGFDQRNNISYMKIVNPENGSTITGEAGDNIGRGGRKTIYFKDESAHYERPEKIEAALGDNTNVQIDISSVNGPNTVFQRKVNAGEIWAPGKNIKSGVNRVLVLDWRDHPFKTRDWYEKRRAKAEREGLLPVFRQEVDRDATATMDGVVIPAEWIRSAIDAHLVLKLNIEGQVMGGFDVADEGADNHALAIRKGIVLKECSEWHDGDTGEAFNKALKICVLNSVTLLGYDCLGVGAGVKAEANRLKRDKKLDKRLKIVPWNASNSPLYPKDRVVDGDDESPLNIDFFASLKSQGWWRLRTRFEKTHRAIVKKEAFDVDELISLPSDLEDKESLIKQLSQATYTTHPSSGKLLINKAPKGSKSPNKADAVVISYWPIMPKTVLL